MRMRDELHDDLGVAGGLKKSAVALQPNSHVAQIYQVAVVRDGDQALGGVDPNRLRVEQCRIASRGIARVADGEFAGQFGEHIVGKNIRDQAHALDVGEICVVGGCNSGRLLSAMLQRVQREVGLARGIRMAVNGDHAAFFAEFGV